MKTAHSALVVVQVLGETPAGEVLKAEAEDGGGGRKRQHIFLSEEPALPNAMQARANWERGLKLADSTGALLEIHRWDILPSLLPVGGLVRVNAAKVGVQGMALLRVGGHLFRRERPALAPRSNPPSSLHARALQKAH